MDAARGGSGDAVVVLGEAGVGKSRLTREVETLARSEGFRTLRGRAVEGSAGAFRPIAEALLSTLRAGDSSVDALGKIVELDPFRPILGRLVPEWRPEGEPASGRSGAMADDSTILLAEAILRLLRVLGAGRGCLLVLEDLHWADAETLEVVEYLVDNLRMEPVLLLVTIRSDERSPALMGARAMAARRVGNVLELPRLDGESVEVMARVCLGVAICPEPVVVLLTSYTEGLPFLVEELLASWVGSGALVRGHDGWTVAEELSPVAPLTFADTVKRRLRNLEEETRRVLGLAAILGPHFDWTLLPKAAGLDEQEVLDRLRDAIDAQLVTTDGAGGARTANRTLGRGSFAFRHALTQAAVLAELLPPEQAALSARMLTLVEEASPGLPGEWCDLAASLAAAAGDTHHSAGLLLQSGRRALAEGALATAESTLDRARGLERDDETLVTEIEEVLTEVLSLAGKWERVVAVGEHALTTLRVTSGTEDRQAEVHLCIARLAIAAGRWDEAADHLDQARSLAAGMQRADVLARSDALAAHLAIERAQVAEAVAFAQAALDGAERASQPAVACEALEVLGRCARVGDLDGAEAAFERARRIAEQNGLTVWRIRALHELGTIDIFRNAQVDRLLEARNLAVGAGALGTAAVLDVQIAAYLEQRSQFEAVLEVAHRSEDMARRLRLHVTAAAALVFQAGAHAKLGNRAGMEAAIAEALHLAGGEPDIVAGGWEARAFASLMGEQRAQALYELEAAMSVVEGMPATTPGPFRGVWALIRTIEGIDGSAACELVRRSGVMINPVNRAYVGYAEAILLGRSGRGAEAAVAVERADAGMTGIDWFRHLGHRFVAEAAVADGWGHPAAWLWDASVYFESQGRKKLVSACKVLMRRAGVPGTRTGRTYEGVPVPFRTLGITRREIEVLTLLVEGLSNKEIAARLYLSPRTVEKHVASLLAKTETRTRSQLAALTVSATGQAPTGA